MGVCGAMNLVHLAEILRQFGLLLPSRRPVSKSLKEGYRRGPGLLTSYSSRYTPLIIAHTS